MLELFQDVYNTNKMEMNERYNDSMASTLYLQLIPAECNDLIENSFPAFKLSAYCGITSLYSLLLTKKISTETSIDQK